MDPDPQHCFFGRGYTVLDKGMAMQIKFNMALNVRRVLVASPIFLPA
jgi:hypothetical protein